MPGSSQVAPPPCNYNLLSVASLLASNPSATITHDTSRAIPGSWQAPPSATTICFPSPTSWQATPGVTTTHDTPRAMPASWQAPSSAPTTHFPSPAPSQVAPRATATNSPAPNLSVADQLRARRQRAESTQNLFRAVKLNNIAKVKELLEKGADPNVLGKNDLGTGVYPILIAVQGKFNEVLDLLIEHKANVDATTPGFGTAFRAFDNQSIEHLHELIESIKSSG
jgi:hypothetical protein